MAERMKRLVEGLNKAGLDCALIHKPENMRYLTGYTGEGCVLVQKDVAVILTDFRYIEQAGRQAPDCRVVRVGGDVKLTEALSLLVPEGAHLALEEDYITVEQYHQIQNALPRVNLENLSGLPEHLRMVKDAGEIALIRRACEISCAAFQDLLTWIRPGMTEKQVQVELDYTLMKLGADCAGFDTIACAGLNGSLPHAIPGDRPIEKGELLTLDFGAQYAGYKSDMTRTIGIGKVSEELKEMYETVYRAQIAALEAVKPGAQLSCVDGVARTMLDAKYPGAFGHSLGHGVGLVIHEQPSLSWRDHRKLEAGQVVTVEPGVYIPGLGGCRIEDMGVVTESGFDNMITAPKHFIEV